MRRLARIATFRRAMATNAASHNAAGIKTGPATEQPPPVSAESKNAIKNAEKKAKFEAKKAKQQQQQSKPQTNGAPKEKPAKAKAAAGVPKYVEETPKGQKKILKPLDDPICQSYHPQAVESAWDAWWEQAGFYKPEYTEKSQRQSKGTFVIPIPPPNCTGILHSGHAVATTLQDALIRWYRMRGYTTLYLPGSDHAGISLQAIVEKRLWREKGKTRHEMGRQEFLDLCYEWKDDIKAKIMSALRRLGGSMDWSREAFTMDANLSAAVAETFIRLHDEGLIYRANKLVNWSTQLRTTISNLEVDNLQIEGTTKMSVPGYDKKIEFGSIWYFKYPLDGSDDFIEVATTRPETMLGDSGVAVNPSDPRYQHLIGKMVRHPFIDRLMPIVADEHADPETGTGAVKLTPAHDPNDFDIGKRHDLAFINILNDDGTLNENAGPMFTGQRRFDARYAVIEALTQKNLFVKKESNPMMLPICNRSSDVIEPRLKPQWWMSMKDLAAPAIAATERGELTFKPESSRKTFLHWLNNINDWCLSRQLIWGHACPAYKLVGITDVNGGEAWVAARSEEDALEKAKKRYPGQSIQLEADPDVLDTWFSSGLWPFSTLGWPSNSSDFEKFYPTSLLETGWDILFFWVARMVMLGLKLTGKLPFSEVYCHGLIRDSEGRKMSKSLGNTIDPIDIIEGIALEDLHAKLRTGNLDPKELAKAELYQKTAFKNGIPECGTDALRFALAHFTGTGGEDVNLNIDAIHMYRRFCNKVYQATKFALGKFPETFSPHASPMPTGAESLAEQWILHKFAQTTKDYNNALENRAFGAATRIVYDYFYDLCDTYIENSKTILSAGNPQEQESALNTLYTALEGSLQLMHPFMPFVTEELWQRLPRRDGDDTSSIMLSEFPEFNKVMDNPEAAAAYDIVIGCSKTARAQANEYGIKEGGEGFIRPAASVHATVTSQIAAIKTLAGKMFADIEVLEPSATQPSGCVPRTVSADATFFIRIKGRIDIDAENKKVGERLKKTDEAISKQNKTQEKMEGKAEAAMALEESHNKLRDLHAERDALQEALQGLEQLKLEG